MPGFGTDKSVHTIHIQALYLGSNFAAAAKASSRRRSEEDAGRRPRKKSCSYWRMRPCNIATRPVTGKRWRSSSPTTQARLLAESGLRHCSAPGVLGGLAVDVARLKIETGTMRAATNTSRRRSSRSSTVPGRGRAHHDKGYAAGLLGSGPELRAQAPQGHAAKSLAEDRKSLNASADAAEAKDAKTLFNEVSIWC